MLSFNNIRFIPSIHQRIAFAQEVRRAFDEFKPDCIAVEFPEALKEYICRGVLSLPRLTSVCYPAGSGEMLYTPIDPCDSLVEGVRIAIERELPIAWIDGKPGPLEESPLDLPDDLMIEKTGLEAYVETAVPFIEKWKPADELALARREEREWAMARRLLAAARGHERVLCVLGLGHYASVRSKLEQMWDNPNEPIETEPDKIDGAFLSRIDEKSLPEIFREVPYVVYQWEMSHAPGAKNFGKLSALKKLLKLAERRYRDNYKAEINITRFKALYQYSRNLALVGGRLQPDCYEMVIGAQSCVDGDFGYEVYQLARSYPLDKPEEGNGFDAPETDANDALPSMIVRGRRGTFSDREEKYRMTSSFGERSFETIKLRFRRRPPVEMLEFWKEQWDSMDMRGICSWPPEDERQEKFMTHVRKRALQVISEDKKQVVEFTTSLLDGLDIRETTRNWHTNKLYVQQTPQPHGKCGAVVLVFEDESRDPLFPWRITLYAENQNESDISFYATPLGEKVVGPRISKTEFGGILSIYPSTRIPDIWSFPIFGQLRNCGDILLAAAFMFSPDRYIAYVAAKPPSSLMKNLAARYKKHVIYLPIGSFSPTQIKKIRTFHILNGHDVRNYAADYIFDD